MKLVRLLNISKESLFRESQLHLRLEESNVVEVGDYSLHRHAVPHLHHSAPFFSLEKLDPNHVAVQAEQVEYPCTVHVLTTQTINHCYRTLGLVGRLGAEDLR